MTWTWIVDEGVVPAPGALEELQTARMRMPDAVLLASRIVLSDESLDPGSEPMARILDKSEMIHAARVGLLAVRAVRPGSFLVRTDIDEGRALAQARDPSSTLAASAALLADRRGAVAPMSVATRSRPRPRESALASLALLREPSWTRDERLMHLFSLAGGGRRRGARAAR